MSNWTFLTNHAHVLLCIARDPDIRLRDIAKEVGITERAAHRIVAELSRAGYLERVRDGLRNHYRLHPELPLRHRLDRDHSVGEILGVLKARKGSLPAPESMASVIHLEPRRGEPDAPKSLLLVIRSADDIKAAVEAASKVLAHRRRNLAESHQQPVDVILGIWIRSELDTGLPAWVQFDQELAADPDPGSRGGQRAAAQIPIEAAIGIRASFSLSGLWSLCWIDGPLLRGVESSDERRHRILDAILTWTAENETGGQGVFYPVFTATASGASIATTMQALHDRHRHFVASGWFIDSVERGLGASINILRDRG